MKFRSIVFLSLASAFLTSCTSASQHRSRCEYWQAKVDPSVETRGRQFELPSDAEAADAIECLLQLRGHHEHAAISGATRLDVSQRFPSASVALAALYYVSYIYTTDRRHGDGIALVDSDYQMANAEQVDRAFDYVSRWLDDVRREGIARIRKEHRDPLAGSGLEWYGNVPEER